MSKFIHFLKTFLPTMALSLLLAITVWVVAISQKDPTEDRRFTNTVSVEVVGLGEGLVMTNTIPENISLKLRAPESVWQRITNDRIGAKAIVDVTGLGTGEYEIPLKIEVGVQPILVTEYSPATVKVILERYATRDFDVVVTEVGEIPTAFRSEAPVASPATVRVGGSVSLLDQIDFVRVVLDHSNATETITRDLNVAAIGMNGTAINNGLVYSPEKINVKQEIKLRGGYRVVVVKVMTTGSVPDGYRVAKIGVTPSVVTIYSSDSALLESVPSYVETDPVDLSEFSGDASVKLALNLPNGISLVGDQSVKVEIQITAIEGATTINDVPVYVIGLADTQTAQISPSVVDIYLGGPQPILNVVKPEELYAVLDLQNYTSGHYQLEPKVDLGSWEGLSVQSIVPGTIDITIFGPEGEATNTPQTSLTTTIAESLNIGTPAP